MTSASSPRIFVSYSSVDSSAAAAIEADLRRHEFSCWMAPRDIEAGADWGESIVTALRGCAAVVLVFSANIAQSGHVRRELALASAAGTPIVPFRIDDSPVPLALMYHTGWTIPWPETIFDGQQAQLDALVTRVKQAVDGQLGHGIPREVSSLSRTEADRTDRDRTTRWLLTVLNAASVVTLCGIAAEALMLVNPEDDFDEDDAAQFMLMFLPVFGAMTGAAAALFLNWFLGVHARLRGLGRSIPAIRSESVVSGFLVPVRNAFAGTTLLQALWHASSPPGQDVPLPRRSWWTPTWWLLALLGSVLFVHVVITVPADVDELAPVAREMFVATVALLGAVWGARRFVLSIERRLHAWTPERSTSEEPRG